MTPAAANPELPRFVTKLAFGLFIVALGFHAWAVTLGWRNINLPGYEFRQAQTAVSALFIQRDHDFSLAYPTPVLGAPWSIPFEFPLYQWAVVVVSDVTGLPLAAAGRLVGIGCFYLTLIPLFLLLRRCGLAAAQSVVALALVLTSPLYIYYTRAFLIESMALMFAVWYLAALVEAKRRAHRGWLAVAILAGVGAGLVKVTTFLGWLLPAFALALVWLWQARPAAQGGARGPFLRTFLWLAAAHLPPFLAAWAWVRYSDAVKALNPSGAGLTSEKLAAFNFGTGRRLDPHIWSEWWSHLSQNLAAPMTLGLAALIAIRFGGRWRWWVAGSIAVFCGVLLIFPVLYAIHTYYFYANGVLLLIAIGFAFAGMMETRRLAGIACALAALFCGVQAKLFLDEFAPVQRARGNGGGLADALRTLTDPDESLIIAGADWSSILPYYSERRTLMVRSELPSRPDYLHVAFELMQSENVAAVVLMQQERNNLKLLNLAGRYFDIDPVPVLTWKRGGEEATVYMVRRSAARAVDTLRQHRFHEVTAIPRADIGDSWEGREVAYADIQPARREVFRLFTPQPVRFSFSFQPQIATASPTDERFSAHPDAKLWFALPPGPHRVRTSIGIVDEAWQNVPPADASDGVELVLAAARSDGSRSVLQRRHINPLQNPADRGMVAIDWTVNLPADAQLELSVNGGPAGSGARDWAWLGPIRIE